MSAKSRKDKILEAMEYLEGKDYAIIESLYGFNGKPRRSVKSVKKYFKVSDIYLTVLREKLEELIEEVSQRVEYVEEEPEEYGYYNVEKVDPEIQKLIDKMSTAFFDMFPDTNPLAVEKSLKILPKKTQNVIFLFYGLDGIHCLDYDEIAEQLEITIDEVDEMLEKGINKLKKHFKNIDSSSVNAEQGYSRDNKYGMLVSIYGKEKVDEVILLLPELSQRLIEDFSTMKDKLTFREIGERHGIDVGKTHNKIYQGLTRIEQILTSKGNESFLDNFYDRFKGYSIENINSVIKKLNYEERKILIDFIGLDAPKLTFTEIVETYNKSEEEVKDILRTSMTNVENALKKFKKKYNKSTSSNTRKNVKQKEENKKTRGKKPEDLTKFYDALIREYGLENFNFALSKLRKETQELLSLYLGLNGESLSVEDLCDKYGISKNSLKLRIKNNVKSMKKVLENPTKYVSEKSKKNNKSKRRGLFLKYDLLVGKYGVNAVEEAIYSLSLKDQDILKMSLGIACTPVSNSEIAKKYDLNTGYVSNRIAMLLTKVENMISNPQPIKKNRYQELVDKYGEEVVKEALYSLKQEYVDTLELVFGINGVTLSQTEVASKLNVGRPTISLRVKKGLEKIVERIENPKMDKVKVKKGKTGKVKENKYAQLIEKYGEEAVKEALSKIKEKYQNILRDYYGIEGQELTAREIQEKYGIGSSSIQIAIKSGIKNIVELIENPSLVGAKSKTTKNYGKANKYQELVEKYGEEVVKEALSKVKEKYQRVLKDYYGIECEELTSRAIQEKYNMGASSVSLSVKLGIRDIVDFIEKPQVKTNRKATKRVNLYQNLVNKYGEEKVRENLIHIDEKNREIIKLYYGIDCEEMQAKDIAEKYGILPNVLSIRIKRNILKLENIIVNGPNIKKATHKKRTKTNKYQELINKYGKEKVEQAFSKLKENYQIVLKAYYGIDQVEMGQSAIHEKYNIPLSTIGYLINKGIKNIEDLIVNPQAYANFEKQGRTAIVRENKYETLAEKYGREKVEETLLRLPEKVQIVIKAYYGIDETRLSASKIHEKYDIALSTIHYLIKKGIKDIELMIENPDFGITKKERMPKPVKEKDTRYQDLINKYGKENVEKALSMLNEKNQLVFNYYFISNISQKEIAKKLNLSSSNISYIITKGIKHIETFMLDPNNENKKEEFYSKFQGYSKEDVDYALSKIGETYRLIIEATYGLKGEVLSNNEISLKSDVPVGSVSHFRYQGIKKIKEKLSNMIKEKLDDSRKGANFKALIDKYGEDLVKVATSKLIVSDRGFLGMYYTFANNKKYTISELSQKIGLDEKELADHELMIIGRLEKLLDVLYKEAYLKKMREEFALQTKSNQFYVKQALQTLRKDDLKLLGLYYGLNGKDVLTLQELSVKLGIEEEKIKNRVELLMRKIKHYIPLGKK